MKWRSGPVLANRIGPVHGRLVRRQQRQREYNNVLADLQVCQQGYLSNPDHRQVDNQKGFRWCENLGGFSLVNTVVPPSSSQYQFGWCALRGGGINSNASDGQYQNVTSNHPGGANVLLSDGSARFIKSTVDMRTWWALGTRNGGEVISADAY